MLNNCCPGHVKKDGGTCQQVFASFPDIKNKIFPISVTGAGNRTSHVTLRVANRIVEGIKKHAFYRRGITSESTVYGLPCVTSTYAGVQYRVFKKTGTEDIRKAMGTDQGYTLHKHEDYVIALPHFAGFKNVQHLCPETGKVRFARVPTIRTLFDNPQCLVEKSRKDINDIFKEKKLTHFPGFYGGVLLYKAANKLSVETFRKGGDIVFVFDGSTISSNYIKNKTQIFLISDRPRNFLYPVEDRIISSKGVLTVSPNNYGLDGYSLVNAEKTYRHLDYKLLSQTFEMLHKQSPGNTIWLCAEDYDDSEHNQQVLIRILQEKHYVKLVCRDTDPYDGNKCSSEIMRELVMLYCKNAAIRSVLADEFIMSHEYTGSISSYKDGETARRNVSKLKNLIKTQCRGGGKRLDFNGKKVKISAKTVGESVMSQCRHIRETLTIAYTASAYKDDLEFIKNMHSDVKLVKKHSQNNNAEHAEEDADTIEKASIIKDIEEFTEEMRIKSELEKITAQDFNCKQIGNKPSLEDMFAAFTGKPKLKPEPKNENQVALENMIFTTLAGLKSKIDGT